MGHYEGRYWIQDPSEVKPEKFKGLNITAYLRKLADRADTEGLTESQILTETERICAEFRKPKAKWYGEKKLCK
jgi:hypothetical protein